MTGDDNCVVRLGKTGPGLVQISFDGRFVELPVVTRIDDDDVLNVLRPLIRIRSSKTKRFAITRIFDESFASTKNDNFIVR